MNKSRGLRSLILGVIVIALVALVVWGYLAGQKERAVEAEREKPVATPTRVSVDQGVAIVTLDAKTQAANAIAVTSLQAGAQQQRIRAYGSVVAIQGLIDGSHNYRSARAQLQKAQATLDAARREYERLKGLNRNDRNISDKVVQAAEAAWRSAQADTETARVAMTTAADNLRTQWGPVIAKWVTSGNAQPLERLLTQRDALVQVTVPGDLATVAAPQEASLQGAGGKLIPARLVSASPRIDAAIQGPSFYYLGAATGLVPGMNVIAWLPAGASANGVVIPASAVVWWQGKAWAYFPDGADRFARRAVPTGNPVEDGWFVPGAAALRVVTSGAQLLFSEEFRAQVKVGD